MDDNQILERLANSFLGNASFGIFEIPGFESLREDKKLLRIIELAGAALPYSTEGGILTYYADSLPDVARAFLQAGITAGTRSTTFCVSYDGVVIESTFNQGGDYS